LDKLIIFKQAGHLPGFNLLSGSGIIPASYRDGADWYLMLLHLFITFFLAAGVSFLITPKIIHFCRERNLFDNPGGRHHHERPIPKLGGMAIYIAFLFALLISFPFLTESLKLYPTYVFAILGIVIAGGLCFLMGLFDDLFGIDPKLKFLFQLAIAFCLVIFGVRIEYITRPGDGMIFLPMWMSAIVTIFWVVAVMNAINLTDGLDGLAGGISFIAGGVFLAIALMRSDLMKAEIPAFLSAAMIGGILGFLPFNFPKAKIFLGDSGSQLIGFLLATISIVGSFKGPTFLAIAIPVIVLGIPILDTSFAIVRRSIKGKKIYEADDEHIHYVMLRFGLTPNQTVLILCGITFILGIVALTVSGCF
jgi:UDP-GlcNAc:undecaprenyl-phosphate GlcNAc-1-phosphate transferase